MLQRDRLNEFELDWAQAAVRSGQIPLNAIKNKKILIVGGESWFCQAIAWSFQAWNELRGAEILVKSIPIAEDGTLSLEETGGQEDSFLAAQADWVVIPGGCCKETENVIQMMKSLRQYEALFSKLAASHPERMLLLSDGRVYGKLAKQFAASEYEAGETDSCRPGMEAQYYLQALEGMFVSAAGKTGCSWQILRSAMIYGPEIPMMDHAVSRLASYVWQKEAKTICPDTERVSYISIHDILTAIQFMLTAVPERKIMNAAGLSSDASEGEIAMQLYQNFPDQFHLTMECSSQNPKSGMVLNTQLIQKYGFQPSVTLEDGMIILVKSLAQTKEVFIFDHTYLGKLTKVQTILLGYLLEIDRICRKHKIHYFLAGGTLLGAIRHHGFIPWDDDADVMMLREDYDHFLEVAQKELPDNIFVQIPSTEKGNHNPFTKLRINNTLFATEFTGHFLKMHNGIFFDVLSHDKTGNHKWSQKLHLMATMLSRSVVFNKWGNTNIKSGGSHPLICKFVDHAKYLVPMPFAEWVQNKMLRFFQNRPSEYLYDGMGRNLKRGAFPKKWLEETVYVEFEGYLFPVPKEYDKYLTYLYGDYMQMIPVSSRRTSHSIVLTDLGEYSDYCLDETKKKGNDEINERNAFRSITGLQ